MCLQYRHLTDTVYAFSFLSTEEESCNHTPRSEFSAVVPRRHFNMQQIIMHGKNVIYLLCGVFKWSLMFVGKKLCRTKKSKKIWVKETAQSCERTLKKEMCCACHNQRLRVLGWEEMAKWYLMVLRRCSNCFHSGVVGTTCLVVLGRRLVFLSFQCLVVVMGFTFLYILAWVFSQMSHWERILHWDGLDLTYWVMQLILRLPPPPQMNF